MTGTLPQAVQEVFDRFMTTELTTVDSRGQPIVWPVTPYCAPGATSIDVTTGVGYPKKAEDARAHPRVGLLFSDPTGSGIEGGIRVLVQGTAEVDDRDLKANFERYRAESDRKVPLVRKKWFPPAPADRLFNWYFERIYIKTRPERVFVWPDGDPATAPTIHGADLEEVRSGHTEKAIEPPPPPAGGGVRWDERMEELCASEEQAVLSWLAPDGFPISVRLPISCDRERRLLRIGVEPAGMPLLEGRACLVAHSHAPDYAWVKNFQVRGDLIRDEDGWALAPRKLVGGMEHPDEGMFAGVRDNIGTAVRCYRTRRRFLRERDS
jgi:pyridoxamine 5'-phosphate oxidase-like protein